jgi:hypothetical protein
MATALCSYRSGASCAAPSAPWESEGGSGPEDGAMSLEGPGSQAGMDGQGGGDGAIGCSPPEQEVEVGSREWWRREKDKASKKAGRKVWAWELDAPPGHPFYVNESKFKSWEDTLMWHDPPPFPDILSMEPIPRPEMPNWWCPTACGTLNLSHALAGHCFPVDGSQHHVCCTDIPLPDETEEKTMTAGTRTLVQSIRKASHASSYSWCTCTHSICTELLGGVVLWDQHSLTRERHYMEQINKGFDLVGWEWLVGGLDAIDELSMHPLPEDDPEYRDPSSWGGGGGGGGPSRRRSRSRSRRRRSIPFLLIQEVSSGPEAYATQAAPEAAAAAGW